MHRNKPGAHCSEVRQRHQWCRARTVHADPRIRSPLFGPLPHPPRVPRSVQAVRARVVAVPDTRMRRRRIDCVGVADSETPPWHESTRARRHRDRGTLLVRPRGAAAQACLPWIQIGPRAGQVQQGSWACRAYAACARGFARVRAFSENSNRHHTCLRVARSVATVIRAFSLRAILLDSYYYGN